MFVFYPKFHECFDVDESKSYYLASVQVGNDDLVWHFMDVGKFERPGQAMKAAKDLADRLNAAFEKANRINARNQIMTATS